MDNKDKYRLWDEENKQMHYDDFVITSTGFAVKITEVSPNIFQFDQSDLEFDKKMKKMRCIGFGDKEGTLIYQGDIVKSGRNYIGIIEYGRVLMNDTARAYSGFYIRKSEDDYKNLDGTITILGNIYENAELLEEK